MELKNNLQFDGTLASVCEYLELLPVFNEAICKYLHQIQVTNIECDTRRVVPGTIFYAKRGANFDPFLHLEEIKQKGAVAILVDGPELESTSSDTAMHLIAKNDTSVHEIKHVLEDLSDETSINENAQGDRENSISSSLRNEAKNAAEEQRKSNSNRIVPPQAMGSAAYQDDSAKDASATKEEQDNFSTAKSADILSLSKNTEQNDASFDADRELRSGRKVVTSYISDPKYAMRSFRASTGTEESKRILDARMLRLVLPSNKSLSGLAGFIYGNPSHKLKLIGVTGTNGKSTITNLVAQMLNLSGHKCAVFGTLGYGFLDDLQKSANTTLDAISLQRELAHYVEQGADFAVLEVSSIGFCEGRVSGLKFYAGGFSNLSRDHLDYHKTMEDYFESKVNFLNLIPASRLVVNRNNSYGKHVAELFPSCFEVGLETHYFDKRSNHHFLNIKKVNFKPASLELLLNNGEQGFFRTDLNLLGYFNAENYAVACGIMLAMGFDYKHLARLTPKLKAIKGRMECFTKDAMPRLIVDYAHTPDGVEQALKAAQNHTSGRGRIFAIIGCGGDRDKGKRPAMAMKASIFADYAIFTADNPRTEDLYEILDDMLLAILPSPAAIQMNDILQKITLANLQASDKEKIDLASPEQVLKLDQELAHEFNLSLEHANNNANITGIEYVKELGKALPKELPGVNSITKNVMIIPDRYTAIKFAFEHAKEQDCIVIAGKGHEDYQIFADRTIHFSDREVCCELLDIELPELVGKDIFALRVEKEAAAKAKAKVQAEAKEQALHELNATSNSQESKSKSKALTKSSKQTKATKSTKVAKASTDTKTTKVTKTTKLSNPSRAKAETQDSKGQTVVKKRVCRPKQTQDAQPLKATDKQEASKTNKNKRTAKAKA